jgi:hypothetical protein
LIRTGVISPLEDSLFKDYRVLDRTKNSGRLSYYLKASYEMPTVYYNFIRPTPTETKRVISGNISITTRLTSSECRYHNSLEGIQITVSGEQAITNSEGNFRLESNKFEAGKSYSCV